MTACPTCGQEMWEVRATVRLTPLKARIFDVIKRAGPDGIDNGELFEIVLRERGVHRDTLRVHVFQINEKLADTDCIIKCYPPRGMHGAYRLAKRRTGDGAA